MNEFEKKFKSIVELEKTKLEFYEKLLQNSHSPTYLKEILEITKRQTIQATSLYHNVENKLHFSLYSELNDMLFRERSYLIDFLTLSDKKIQNVYPLLNEFKKANYVLSKCDVAEPEKCKNCIKDIYNSNLKIMNTARDINFVPINKADSMLKKMIKEMFIEQLNKTL